MLETDENVFFTDSPGASNAAWPSRDLPDREQKSPSVFLPWGLLLLAGKIQRDFANKLLSRQYNPNRERATVFSSHGSCYFLVLGYKGEDSNAKKKTSKAMQKKGYVFRFTSNTMYKHSAKTTLTTVALSLGST